MTLSQLKDIIPKNRAGLRYAAQNPYQCQNQQSSTLPYKH